MRLITEITAEAVQNHRFGLADGTSVSFTIRYVDNQKGWFYSTEHVATGFKANNRRAVVSPNMLRAFRNIIPFGLAVITKDGQEPIFQEDFAVGRAKLYLLDEEDVLAAESIIHA